MRPSWLPSLPSLRIGIPILVLAFTLASLVFNTCLHQRFETEREHASVLAQAHEDAERLAESVLAQEDTRPRTEHELNMLSQKPGLNWAVISLPDQTVLHRLSPSADPESVAAALGSPEIQALMDEAVRTGKPAGKVLSSTQTLAVHPVALDPLRLAVINRDPSGPVGRERMESIWEAVSAAGVQVVACLLLWWALDRFISRRMRQLLSNARLLPGVAPLEGPLKGRDEFAQIARALQESENFHKQIAENVRDVFFVLHADRRVLYISPAYEEVFKHPPPSAQDDASAWLADILPEDRGIVLSLVDPLSPSRREAEAQYRIQQPDGTIRWLETRAFPIFDADGKIYRYAGLTTDVTARKRLEQEVLDISERERRRIGHDLHDDLCQRLAAIKLTCEMLSDKLKSQPGDAAKSIQDVGRHIGEAAMLCRGLARGLAPVNLENEGFVHALEKLVETSRNLHHVLCYLDCPQPVPMANTTTASHLYRITQELITNAAKHAMPSRVYVGLRQEKDYLRLEVANDGSVFIEPAKSENEGMGLRIIRYRANAIGASIQFLRRGNGMQGTTAVCCVPLSACHAPASKNPANISP